MNLDAESSAAETYNERWAAGLCGCTAWRRSIAEDLSASSRRWNCIGGGDGVRTATVDHTEEEQQ